MKPSMKLFLDTADVAVIKDMVPTGMVDGVTTNPSLIAKSGRNIAEVIAEMQRVQPQLARLIREFVRR
jgi:transaldolase